MIEIGVVADPLHWDRWDEAKAFLEPARKLAGCDEYLGENEILWVALDGDEMLAAITAWLGDGEVRLELCGGRDHRRWIGPMTQAIAESARAEGAKSVRVAGRRGWVRALAPAGWRDMGTNGRMHYVRLVLEG